MTVRKWNASDLAAVAEMESLLQIRPWNLSQIGEEFDNPSYRCLVLEAEGSVIGYAGFYRVSDYAEISNVGVRQEFWGKGCGKRLLTSLFELASSEGLYAMTLEVAVSNQRAIGLYHSLGFSEEGQRKDYYGKGEHALIMWRRWNPQPIV